MHMPDLPKALSFAQVSAALDTLELPADGLLEVAIRPGSVEVTYLRTDANGEVLIGGPGSLAKISSSIRIQGPKTLDAE